MTPPDAPSVSEIPVRPAALRAGPGSAPALSLTCLRCRHRFEARDCDKLDHFAIYKAVCPECGWPGRYLASELKTARDQRRMPR